MNKKGDCLLLLDVTMRSLLIILSIVCNFAPVDSKKILLMPVPFPSHIRTIHWVGEKMASRGHDVYSLLVDNAVPEHKLPMQGIKPIYFNYSDTLNETYINDVISVFVWNRTLPDQSNIQRIWEDVVHNKELMRRLRQHHFDLAVVDSWVSARTIYLVPHALSVKYIAHHDSSYLHVGGISNLHLPSFMSYQQLNLFQSIFTQDGILTDMTFVQRIINLLGHFVMINNIVIVENTTMLEEFAPTFSSYRQLPEEALLHLVPRHDILTGLRGRMPNIIHTAGWSMKPAKRLPENLRSIMDAAEKAIICSFGSTMTELPKHVLSKFLTAFSKVNHTVIFKTVVKPEYNLSVPANVHVSSWFPQNDLLGHHSTKLFISHCGMNGEHEAIYHGVPIIGFPLFVDQFINCAKLQKTGLGVCMDIFTFDPDDLVTRIRDVGAEGSLYKENVDKKSAILRDIDPSPLDTVAWWIEHVMKHGGDHLRSPTLDMPWYQYWMVDMILFFLLLFHLALFCFVIVVKCFIRLVTKKAKQD